MFMFPLAVLFYAFVMVVAEESQQGFGSRMREADMFLASDGLTWLVVAVYWCVLWRTAVNWNTSRILGTFLSALGAAIVGGLAGWSAGSLIGPLDAGFGVFIGGILAIILWLIATVFIWRETAAERAQRIKGSSKSAVTCPTCGYNLTGLSESRCPECGSKFTLDELLALQLKTDKDIE